MRGDFSIFQYSSLVMYMQKMNLLQDVIKEGSCIHSTTPLNPTESTTDTLMKLFGICIACIWLSFVIRFHPKRRQSISKTVNFGKCAEGFSLLLYLLVVVGWYNPIDGVTVFWHICQSQMLPKWLWKVAMACRGSQTASGSRGQCHDGDGAAVRSAPQGSKNTKTRKDWRFPHTNAYGSPAEITCTKINK